MQSTKRIQYTKNTINGKEGGLKERMKMEVVWQGKEQGQNPLLWCVESLMKAVECMGIGDEPQKRQESFPML